MLGYLATDRSLTFRGLVKFLMGRVVERGIIALGLDCGAGGGLEMVDWGAYRLRS